MAAEETKAEPAPGPAAAPGAEQEVVAFAGGLRGRRAAQLGAARASTASASRRRAAASSSASTPTAPRWPARRARRGPRSPTGASSSRPTRWPWPRTSSSSARRRSSARAAGRRRRVALRTRRSTGGASSGSGRATPTAPRACWRACSGRAPRSSLSGNANEYRPYADGAASLTCAELCSCLPPPCFELRSLRECRFDGPAALAPPPLAWRAVFRRTPAAWAAPDPGDGDDDGASGTPTAASARASTSGGGSLRKLRRDEPPRLLQKRRERPVVARKVSRVPLPLDARPADYDSDAIDARCPSTGPSPRASAGPTRRRRSRAPTASRTSPRRGRRPPGRARARRGRRALGALVGPAGPGLRPPRRVAPILQELCDRVARAALRWAPAPANPRQPLVAVDLAAGAGHTAWALARHCRRPVRAELVEPCARHGGARARARGARPGRGVATVWQVPVERCAERLPARLRGAADCVTCRGALSQINEHDVLEAAAALLKPGGCLVLDLEHGEPGRAWEDHVRDALRAAGVAAPADVARVPSLPPARPACSASQLAAAAAAAACGSPRATPSTTPWAATSSWPRGRCRRRGSRRPPATATAPRRASRAAVHPGRGAARGRVCGGAADRARRGPQARRARGRRLARERRLGPRAAAGGPLLTSGCDLRVIDIFTVTGCHRAQIIYFFRM